MTFKRVLSFNFSSTCKLKTLFSAGFCFHFRHAILFL
ncbi:hypothetical protein ZPR_3616 [Zunongwangia profunda SM-A87]|uniref:Uncharacterized protein n=1 Tax=Zunongwangia profunda (strain DSM 18752 / CCTCC AB 206139 / SM-A87) TaxID=655815 RepID=D5BKL4_ZUNPS|nr:hypothetical protein ZPR_3616 [Zunongwangia profunda SM-A87]